MTNWTPKNGEILKAQTENEYDKYAVAVENIFQLRLRICHTRSLVMCLDIFLKEDLHVYPKPFRIFYLQAIMKTAIELM